MINKRALIVTIPIVLILGIGIGGAITYYVLNRNTKKADLDVCNSDACHKYAKLVNEFIDTTVDPCDSFYDFVCGKFVKENRIPDDRSFYSTFSMVQNYLDSEILSIISKPKAANEEFSSKIVKNFYQSCFNTGDLSDAYIKEIIEKELGGWPLLDNVENSLSSVELLKKITKYGIPSVFNMGVGVDPKNTRIRRIKIQQPEYFNKEYFSKSNLIVSFRNFVNTSLSYLNPNYTYNESHINDLFDINKKFYLVQLDPIQMKSVPPKNMTIKSLTAELPKFPWKNFINDLANDLTSLNIDENEVIIVENWDYVVNAVNLYNDYSNSKKRVLDDFMIFKFFYTLVGSLPIKYLEARVQYEKIFNGISVLTKREVYCKNLAFESLPLAVGKLFVEKDFMPESKNKVIEMTNNILKEFIQLLNETDWMDEQSKQAAKDKANAVNPQIGYPDQIYDNNYLENLYGVDLSPNELSKNILDLLKYQFKRSINILRLTKDRNEWELSPAILNAFYEPEKNQIYFPAGILQNPFYDPALPNYINYGSIGTVIGHEISHGFDDQGRLYDKDGTYYSDGESGLWSNETIQKFKDKAKCISNQYSNYNLKQVNKTVNGEMTLGENIADNGGLRVAFEAYKKLVLINGNEHKLPGLNYTQDQMFFISIGMFFCRNGRDEFLNRQILQDVHSPSEFRVIGMTSNYEEFGKAFDCKIAQNNNPQQKCRVW